MTQPPPLSPTERRSRQRAEVRGAVLAAAESLLVEQGYEAFSMRRLAERCSCTAATLYHYFVDKDALIDELLEDRFGVLRDQMRAVPRRDDAADYLRDLVYSVASYATQKPALYRLLTMPVPASSRRAETAEQTFALIRAPIETLHRDDRLAHGDTDAVGRAIIALLHGVVSLRSSRIDSDWGPEVLELGLDSMLQGVLRSDSPPSTGGGR